METNEKNELLLQLARNAFAALKKERKGKIAYIYYAPADCRLPITPGISVCDGAGSGMGVLNGEFSKEDVDVVHDELLQLGVGKVRGKICR